ncbi:hypothetical protein ACFLVN_05560 [Chloroflexota bacterium]
MELIKNGVPAVILLNEDFVAEAQLIARSRGVPIKYVVVPRTINAMTDEEIEAEIDKVEEQIVQLLSQPA